MIILVDLRPRAEYCEYDKRIHLVSGVRPSPRERSLNVNNALVVPQLQCTLYTRPTLMSCVHSESVFSCFTTQIWIPMKKLNTCSSSLFVQESDRKLDGEMDTKNIRTLEKMAFKATVFGFLSMPVSFLNQTCFIAVQIKYDETIFREKKIISLLLSCLKNLRLKSIVRVMTLIFSQFIVVCFGVFKQNR